MSTEFLWFTSGYFLSFSGCPHKSSSNNRERPIVNHCSFYTCSVTQGYRSNIRSMLWTIGFVNDYFFFISFYPIILFRCKPKITFIYAIIYLSYFGKYLIKKILFSIEIKKLCIWSMYLKDIPATCDWYNVRSMGLNLKSH